MKKVATLLFALIFMCAAGCAKPTLKYWQAAGGSRSDATVAVGYSYNPHTEIPQNVTGQAHEEALKRCRAWGYQEADPFGMVTKNCTNMVYTFGGPKCLEIMVTQQYQCLGRGDAALPEEASATFVGPIKPKK